MLTLLTFIPLVSAAEWIPITGDELTDLYSDTVIKIVNPKGGRLTGHYCKNGTGMLLFKGKKKPRTWEKTDDKTICSTTPEGTRSCFVYFKHPKNPNKIRAEKIGTSKVFKFKLTNKPPKYCS